MTDEPFAALDGLNDAQKEAVTSTEGYVRVVAGAGSGKTRALSRRFAYLVNDMGILPGNILCVTFSNKAANEMRRRIHNLTGDNDTGYVNTFHGFCVSILSEDAHAVGYPSSFLVLDNSDIDSMLKIIYEERGLGLRDMTFKDARDMIEIQKLFKKPEYYLDMTELSLEELREKYLSAGETKEIIFYGYLYQEKKCFGLDYNDLIKFCLYIFEKNEDIKLKWQKRLEYIMIDEFQDIDLPQYELMEVLSAYHRNLFIVGDPDQTIYTWRGANVKYLLDFDRHHPGTKTVMMTDNYRSTPEILDVCNSLISKNKTRIKKNLTPVNPNGPAVICHYGENPEAEAKWMAEEILKIHEETGSFRDIAVLYRAHYVTRSIEDVFRKAEIPYAVYSGVRFYDRAEIKDALSYLRLVVYRDDLSFMRIANVPRRNLGERRMAFIKEYAEKNGCLYYDALKRNIEDEIFKGTKAAKFVKLIDGFSASCRELPVSEVLADILDKSGYELMLRTEGSSERLDNLAELKQSVYEYETSCGEEVTPEHYLAHAALFSSSDAEDTSDRVKLMTVHAAKGLEFPFVFLPELNEGVFPAKKTGTLEAMEEERRLAFVAMTRAEKRLFISNASGRSFDGSPRYPSRFVLDIDKELLQLTAEPPESLIADAVTYISGSEKYMPENLSASVLPVGSRVKHSIMGEGEIIDIDAGRGAYVIKFETLDTPHTISFKTKLQGL